MKYCGYMPNDFINGEGVSVSLWTAGCPHHCLGCFNPETWNYDDAEEVPTDLRFQLIKAIQANGLRRNFSVLGGEPFAPWNLDFVYEMVDAVRTAFPSIKIYIWSGFTFSELKAMNSAIVNSILEKCDVLIDGRFEIEKRDLTLKLRGSSNQNIINLKGDSNEI